MTQFDTQVNALNNDVDNFEMQLKEGENEMVDELGENKNAVAEFDHEVGSCLEQLSKNMNARYITTTEYHEKVRNAMDEFEKQVYKPADESKSYLPPMMPGGERII